MKKIIYLSFIFVLAFALIPSSIYASDNEITIGACLHDQMHGFQMDMGNGIKKEAEKYDNVTLIFTDSELDP